jgi:hypothetical protein
MEVIAHFAGLIGSTVTVTPEIGATIPAGAPRRRPAARFAVAMVADEGPR